MLTANDAFIMLRTRRNSPGGGEKVASFRRAHIKYARWMTKHDTHDVQTEDGGKVPDKTTTVVR